MPNPTDQNHYNASYCEYKNWSNENFSTLYQSEKRYFSSELKRTKKSFLSGARVLEIGFGNGKFLQYAKLNNWNASGTELNSQLIELAKTKNFDVVESATLNSFASDTFDLVVAFDVLEHLNNDEILALLSDVKRVLKNGGVFLARFPNGESPFGLIYQNSDVTHITSIGPGKILHFASILNMKIVFMGGEKRLILRKKPMLILQNLISYILGKTLNFLANLLYKYQFEFSAANSVVVLEKID